MLFLREITGVTSVLIHHYNHIAQYRPSISKTGKPLSTWLINASGVHVLFVRCRHPLIGYPLLSFCDVTPSVQTELVQFTQPRVFLVQHVIVPHDRRASLRCYDKIGFVTVVAEIVWVLAVALRLEKLLGISIKIMTCEIRHTKRYAFE